MSKRKAKDPMRKYSKKGRFQAGEIATLDTFRNHAEVKWADISGAELSPGTAGIATSVGFAILNGIAEGTGPTQRIGRKLFCKNIQLTGMWCRNPQANASVLFPEHMVYYAIVYDRQPTGTKPLISDIYRSIDTGGSAQTIGFVHKNLLNDQRFLILKHDGFFVPQLVPGDNDFFWDVLKINGAGDAPGGNWAIGAAPTNKGKSSPMFEIFLPINQETTYNNSTSDIGSIATGTLWLVTWSQAQVGVDEDVMETPPLHLNYTIRLRFEDK